MVEQTLVIVKPDGVRRKLIGEILATFEQAGLSIVALRMLQPSRDLMGVHYPNTPEWLDKVGRKTIEAYGVAGKDVNSDFGTAEPARVGSFVRSWLIDFICSGSVVAVVLEGNAAVINVRRLCGHTFPVFADPSSIRGRFSCESPDFANEQKRSVENLVHASTTLAEAREEIEIWFPGSSQNLCPGTSRR